MKPKSMKIARGRKLLKKFEKGALRKSRRCSLWRGGLYYETFKKKGWRIERSETEIVLKDYL